MIVRRTIFGALLLTVVVGSACAQTHHVVERPVAAAPTTTSTTPPPYRQVVWAAVRKVAVFAAPDAAAPVNSLPNPTLENQPLAFLAVGQQPGWLQVLMPVRPNGVVGWIHATDVRLGDIPVYRILVELAAHRMTLFKGDEVVLREPAGIGQAKTPTPTGHFYVDAMVKLANPNTVWGPYQMSVSGFSTVLERFGGGLGQIALHGTNTPQLIPGDVSHGCVRLKNDVITKLASLTGIGTPVEIIA